MGLSCFSNLVVFYHCNLFNWYGLISLDIYVDVRDSSTCMYMWNTCDFLWSLDRYGWTSHAFSSFLSIWNTCDFISFTSTYMRKIVHLWCCWYRYLDKWHWPRLNKTPMFGSQKISKNKGKKLLRKMIFTFFLLK